jgi:phage shock protein B
MWQELAPVIAVVALFVLLPWLVLHYITQWKKASALQPGDEHMLEDIWRSAKRMERRIEALEAILDVQTPGWRKKDEEDAR